MNDVMRVRSFSELTCEAVQVGALRQFSRAWVESIGAAS